jgi:hypothetical protein
MKYALITTFEAEQPYRFCEVLDQKIEGDFPGVIWAEIPDELQVTPQTHKYTDEGFVELPPPPPPKPRLEPINPAVCTNTEEATVL